MKPFRTALLLFAGLTVAGCGKVFPSRYVVKNQTGAELTNVALDCTGKAAGRKIIKPGREAWFFCHPQPNATVSVRYSRNGRTQSQIIDGYTVSEFWTDCSITLTAAGSDKPRCHSH